MGVIGALIFSQVLELLSPIRDQTLTNMYGVMLIRVSLSNTTLAIPRCLSLGMQRELLWELSTPDCGWQPLVMKPRLILPCQ